MTDPAHCSQADLNCPICGSSSLTDFFEASNVPAQDGVVYPTREQSVQAPVGDITLAYCAQCQYIFNRSYDPEKISFQNYDFSLHYSDTYQQFVEQLVSSLISNHALREKSVLDIACGLGHFLVQLCQTGNNKGLGIDPSYVATSELSFDTKQISFHKDYYSSKYQDLQVDFITCRHLLDEVNDPLAFLKLFKQNLKVDWPVGVYIEVPDTSKTFSEKLIWNVSYQKRSWFTPHSIGYLMELAGFGVSAVRHFLNGDYLGVEAALAGDERPAAIIENNDLSAVIADFSAAYYRELENWNTITGNWTDNKTRVALWGAGARGINFLSASPRCEAISNVVDINPYRQGKFLPVSSFQVEAPEILREKAIDVIIISNATYAKEIMDHACSLGFNGSFEIF